MSKRIRHLHWRWIALICAAFGMMWKLFLLGMDAFPFNADEAIVGLMARHILAGERPLFFYGQAYMGSLDAALVAGMFQITRISVDGIRWVQLILYAITSYLSAGLVWKISEKPAAVWAAGLMLALPAVNTTLYTTVSLGGYGEAVLIGVFQLHLALDQVQKGGRWRILLWAFLTGFGLWVFGLTLVFSSAAGFYMFAALLHEKHNRMPWTTLPLVIMASLLGAFPWLIAASREGLPALLRELFGGAIAGEGGEVLRPFLLRGMNVFLFGPTVILGLRPPWSVEPLVPVLIPFVIVFWLVIGVQLIRRRASGTPPPPGATLFAAIAGLIFTGLLLTPFGGDPSGRYFLPLAIPMAVGAGFVLGEIDQGKTRWMAWGLFFLTLVFHLVSTLQAAGNATVGITTQFDPVSWIDRSYDRQLQTFLEEHELTAGYTNYWVAYPLAFQSDERLQYVPWLPYHQDFRYTSRDDRYPPYRTSVASAETFAYITTNHPDLDGLLRQRLDEAGVTYMVAEIGDYRIFYQLRPSVKPGDLNLPWLESDA